MTLPQGIEMPVTIKDFIAHCGIMDITSSAIFFAPNIPKDKLTSALSTYANGVTESDVLILVDDTFWGSAKEGLLVTVDALIFNMKGDKTRQAKLKVLTGLSSTDNNIVLNGKTVGSMSNPGKLELGYLFSVLDTYVKLAFRDAPEWEINEHAINLEALLALCAGYVKPDCIKEKLQGEFKAPITRPNYYVGDAIPVRLAQMVKLSLGLHQNVKLIAIQELTRHKSGLGCFAITSEGLFAKRENEFDVLFIPWSRLRDLKVVAEHKENYLRGVLFSNGQTLVTSWENMLILPFGVEIVSDLILLAASDSCETHSKHLVSERPNMKVTFTSNIQYKKTEKQDETPSSTQSTPNTSLPEDKNVKSKYIGIIAHSIESNKPRIIALLKEKTGETSLNALRSEQNVELISSYIYPFLPALVRLALKEDVFLKFMLKNHNSIIQHLITNGTIDSLEIDTSEIDEPLAISFDINDEDFFSSSNQKSDCEHENTQLRSTRAAASDDAKVKSKYIEVIANSIKSNKPRIIALLKETTGEASLNALRSDKNIELIASHLYAFLPALVRMALKEEVFLKFVLENRVRLIQHLTADGAFDDSGADASEALKLQARQQPRKLSSLLAANRLTKNWFANFLSELENGQVDSIENHQEKIYIRILQTALDLPRQLKKIGLLKDEAELLMISQDFVTEEVLAYSLASISHLLVAEAEFNDAQLANFIQPLMQTLLQPYFAQKPGKKSLKALAKPGTPKAMELFFNKVQNLAVYLSKGNRQDLATVWLSGIKALLAASDSDPQIAQSICKRLDESTTSLLQTLTALDEVYEGLLVDYLETVGMPD